MNSNSFLTIWGLDPDDFDRVEGPVIDGDLIVVEAWEARKADLVCPGCGESHYHIHGHYEAWKRTRGDALRKELILIHRIMYRCARCGKTFSQCVKGVEPRSSITYVEKAAIVSELIDGDTYAETADRHSVAKSTVISIFDKAYPTVEGKRLPRILMIDEFKFKTDAGKYVCHLADFEESTTVDLIQSRAKAYLDEYFSEKPESERASVKLLITDMYDEYAWMARKWLPNAKVVVDRFHVVKQLTEAVNRLRTMAMNTCEKGGLYYSFMKQNWKLFLCPADKIPDKWYTKKSTGESWHYDQLIRACLKLGDDLYFGYHTLQELLKLMRTKATHKEALNDVRYIAGKLINCKSELLKKVGETYLKWDNGIAMGLAKCEFGFIVSNGKMEAANNVAQTMIDDAYGCKNFERFRKRFLLHRWRIASRRAKKTKK